MNRRGNFIDVLVIISIIFLLACFMILFLFIQKKVDDGLSNTPIVNNTWASNAIVSNVDNNLPWVLDFFVIMMMFGMPIVGMILAFFNNISPIWFWSIFGFTMLFVVIGGFFAMGYQNFINSGDINTIKIFMPMTNYVMENFILYTLFVTLVIGVGIYAKTQGQQGGLSGL